MHEQPVHAGACPSASNQMYIAQEGGDYADPGQPDACLPATQAPWSVVTYYMQMR